MDVETRILEAAIDRVAAAGYDGTTISAVAAGSGVSRPTVYAHFGTREKLLSEAMKLAASRVLTRIVDQAKGATTAAEHAVEVMIAARAEFRRQPALAPLAFPQRGTLLFDGDTLGPEAVRMAREFLAPLLDFEPRLEPELDEIAETCMRFLVSLVLFESETSRSDERLRGFLHRRLVPALGLRPRSLHI